MTLIEVLKKTQGKIRRKQNPKIVLFVDKGTFYYENGDAQPDNRYSLSVSDIIATDWEHLQEVWKAK